MLVAGLGPFVLIGWAPNRELFKSLLQPGQIAMKPMTAAALVMTAASLWLLRNDPPSAPAKLLARILAAIVVVIALARLCDLLFSLHLGIDRILFHDRLGENTMSPNTATAFLLLAIGLLSIDFETRGEFHPSQVLIILAGCIGLLSLTGYIYRTAELYGYRGVKPMALNT